MDPIFNFYCSFRGPLKLMTDEGVHRNSKYVIQCKLGEVTIIEGSYGVVDFKIEINSDEVIMVARGPGNSQLENIKLAKKAYTQMGVDGNVQVFCTKVGAHARMLRK